VANDWNTQIIEEFRANGGKVGGNFEHMPLVILHTRGVKSGLERETPVAYRPVEGDNIAVFASYAGAPEHPAWYGNLVAHPDVTIEIGGETRRVRARVATGDERTRIWEAQKAEYPGFAEYEEKTDREIPVVVLEPAG
jgi:deazaflavin-dependent oxidoreductase (nitroreductase family)